MTRIKNELVPLCQCNRCGGVYIDNNPQIGAKLHPNMGYPELEKLHEETGQLETGFWGCPVCRTDSYLSDEIVVR